MKQINFDFQLKDIKKVTLLTQENGEILEVKKCNFNTFDKNNYLVKVEMKDLPMLYLEIESLNNNGGEISFKLKAEGFVTYNGTEKIDGLVVKYGILKDNEIIPFYLLSKETILEDIQPEADYYIPDIDRLASMPEFNKLKLIMYSNLYKLIPFYDSKNIINLSNNLDVTHKLNTNKIVSIFPLDSNSIRVVGLDNESVQAINRLKIVYDNDTSETYDIEYLNTKNNISSYAISKLGIYYNYNKFIINKNSEIIKELLNKINKYSFSKDLSQSISEGDHESVVNLYKSNFDITVKSNSLNILINLFSNNPQFSTNIENDILKDLMRNIFFNNNFLQSFLYMYNYVDYWYNFEIDCINLRDVILFDSLIINKTNKLIDMINDFCENTNKDVRMGNKTQIVYKNIFSKYLGIESISLFVEYFISKYANYKDVNDWIIDNFKGGIIVEGKPKNPEVKSRLWRLLKSNTVHKDQQMILPTLSYKGSKDLYIASFTAGIVYGNLKIYDRYNGTEESRHNMKKELENYIDKLSNVYDNLAKITSNKAETINKSKFLLVDSSFYKENHNQDVFQKYYIPLQTFWQHNSAAATMVYGNPNASYVFFNTSYFLNSLDTISHEMGHCTDIWLFLENKGRRPGRTGEDYSNGFANQVTLEYNMNLMQDYSLDSDKMCNLSPNRINSPEKYQKFYQNVFEALYTLDYLQGKAFLQLSPEQQVRIVSQHKYGRKNAYQEENSVNSTWKTLTIDEIKKMNLETLEDLWNNQLTIRPGHRFDISSTNEVGTNNFGAYNIDKVCYASWYIPYVENGNPNAQIFRRNGYELAGILGYTNGLVNYLSGETKTGDLEFYRTKLKNPNFTFKQYRMDKNLEIEFKIKEMANQNTKCFDEQLLINYFKDALIQAVNKNDINNGMSIPGGVTLQAIKDSREAVYRYLQRITNDFEKSIYSTEFKVIDISTKEDFIKLISNNPNGIYKLTKDINLEEALEGDSIINKTFIGWLDGCGYTISGISKPLFNKIANSYISNLFLKGSTNDINNSKLLAIQKYSVIEVTSQK